MAVKANPVFFHSFDQQNLAVHLQARDTKYHIDTALGQTLGPVDIGGLIKPRSQLYYRQYTLAVLHGIDQRIDHPRIPRNSVQTYFDTGHLGIKRRRLQQIDDVIERVVRVIEEYVPLANAVEHAAGLVETPDTNRWQRLELQIFGPDIGKTDEVLGVVITPAGDHAVVFTKTKASTEV